MKATLISIGDELLNGMTTNTNATWIGKFLHERGIKLDSVVTISDDDQAIFSALDQAHKVTDLIIITGGLGPTKDDITKHSICRWLGDRMSFDETSYERIVQAFAKRNIPLTEAHKQQCYFPSSAMLIANDMGTAPGMLFRKDEVDIMSFPGVPYEMKHLMAEQLQDYWTKHSASAPHIHTWSTAGMGETSIHKLIVDIEDDFPETYQLAYLPSAGTVRVQLKAMAPDMHQFDEFAERIRVALGQLVFSESGESLAEALGGLLVQRNEMMISCESCTGGSIAKMITSNPGSSRYYFGSFVSYHNDFKTEIVGVDSTAIDDHGAVSEEVVRQMLVRSLHRSGVKYGVATSGIAGPGGGSTEKPVGTFWVSWGSRDHIRTKRLLVQRERLINIRYISNFALNSLRNFILKED